MSRRVVAGFVVAVSLSIGGASAQDVGPPANNAGDGPAMPNILLPDDWANPNTGGEGGYVNNGVPAGESPEPASAPAQDGEVDESYEGGH
jgi:hypothetical protein